MITKKGVRWYADPDFGPAQEAAYWADVAYQARRESARLAAAADAVELERIYGAWAEERAARVAAIGAADIARAAAIEAAEAARRHAIEAAERVYRMAIAAEEARHAAALDALRRRAIAALSSEEAIDAQMIEAERADALFNSRKEAAARRRAWRRAYYRRKLSKYPGAQQ